MTQAGDSEKVPSAGAEPGTGKRGLRKVGAQMVVGAVLIIAVLVGFLQFYVGPQSQQERERIFRSMNQVSRLIDDRTLAAGLALQTWRGDEADQAHVASSFGIAGFQFGCASNNIVCVSPQEDGAPRSASIDVGVAPGQPGRVEQVSFSLRSIAESAQLPYDEAILLITDSRGNVIAGYDRESKWLQFQSIETLLDTAGVTDTIDEDGPLADASRLVRSAERFGRGEQNRMFEGYPARLSRDVGGQSFAVFVASHQLGKSLDDGALGAFVSTVRASRIAPASGGGGGGGGAAPRASAADQAPDQLFFAYLIPEDTIGAAALNIPYQMTVNFLIFLIGGLLCIPFLKLFNRSPHKPIRLLDTVAILVSTMLLVMTAALLLSTILLRNSIVQDIDGELARLAVAVDSSVSAELVEHPHLSGAAPAAALDSYKEGPASLAPLESAFYIGTSGTCGGDNRIADCAARDGEFAGILFFESPMENINVVDRAYFRAWSNRIEMGGRNYTQFLKNKTNGNLSWSRIQDAGMTYLEKDRAARAAGADVPQARRGLLVSWFPLALRAPVTPRNFSFAVVLNQDLPQMLRGPGSQRIGDVLYHSQQQFSLMENLLYEARDEPELTAALAVLRQPVASATAPGDGVISDRIAISYHAKSYFARVRPVAGTPWSVVAFYDRSEALGILAETVAHSFFVACFWIIVCLIASWLAPRLLRLTLDRGKGHSPRQVPVLARSIWFFPNGLFRFTPDGLSYFFQLRGDELILLLFTLGVQAASLVLMPPVLAVFGVCGISLVALVGHYLLIARPYGQTPSTALRRAVLAITAALFAAALFAMLLDHLAGRWFVFGTVALIAGFLCLNLAVISAISPRTIWALKSNRTRRWLLRLAFIRRHMPGYHAHITRQTIRRAFVNRSIALLLVLIWVPSVAILNLNYTEYFKGYVAASLITVAERIGEQRRDLLIELPALNSNNPRYRIARDEAFEVLGLGKFSRDHPGWFITTPDSAAANNFAIEVRKGTLERDAGATLAWPVALANYFGDAMPTFGRTSTQIRTSSGLFNAGRADALTFDMTSPAQFVPDIGAQDLILEAGPIERYPFHPDFNGTLFAIIFVTLFYILLYQLIRRTATILTGLNLSRIEPDRAELAGLNKLVEERDGPRQAWEAVGSRREKLLLLTLSDRRLPNFRERREIEALVRRGYLALTPFLHIANTKLADYLKHELPPAERLEVMESARAEDDKWEHMRMPLLVIVIAGCAFLLYFSPGTVQLIISGFLALTALLPLVRDPVTRLLQMDKT